MWLNKLLFEKDTYILDNKITFTYCFLLNNKHLILRIKVEFISMKGYETSREMGNKVVFAPWRNLDGSFRSSCPRAGRTKQDVGTWQLPCLFNNLYFIVVVVVWKEVGNCNTEMEIRRSML